MTRAQISDPCCPYCGTRSRFRYHARDWNQHSTDETFEYWTCKNCLLIFIDPLPDDIGRFYVLEQYDIPPDSQGFQVRANSQAWKLKLLAPHVVSGRLLEVGPATGEFATVARSSGFNVTLIEMDPKCCSFLGDALRHNVIQSDDPASCFHEGDVFDVICIWQAIEHIPRFWTFLEAAARHLRPGGVIALSTPNPDSLQARLLRRYWPHGDAPRHLYLISPKWFQRVCGAWGLRIARTTTTDEGSIGLNYYGWYLFVRNRLRGLLSTPKVEQWADRLTRFFRRWEIREGVGCSYVLIMIKQ